MRMYDLIHAKRDGSELTKEEIEYIIEGYCKGKIADYQMSAFLMAVFYKGMTKEETLNMTMAAARSGDMIDLSDINGIKVDKHSTGGVGDNTTLIVAPIVASLGVKVAKMSGRGLGHTGGTIDKLESISGFQTSMKKQRFMEIVNEVGVSVIGQTENIAPADKKMYALRDVTCTVDSIPLIAVSIMSKKLAAGSDCIVLDVKCGSGAFMKSMEDAIKLAKVMVEIGEGAGRKTVALITDMDVPLGKNIGNSLEVIEAIDVLNKRGDEELEALCTEIATQMLVLGQRGNYAECKKMVEDCIISGQALDTFAKMVSAQNGDERYVYDTSLYKKASAIEPVLARESGYIVRMNTEDIGIISVILGAGRDTKDSVIDYSAGIEIIKKTGDYVNKGDVLAYIHTNNASIIDVAKKKYNDALEFSKMKVEKKNIILATVSKDETVICN